MYILFVRNKRSWTVIPDRVKYEARYKQISIKLQRLQHKQIQEEIIL